MRTSYRGIAFDAGEQVHVIRAHRIGQRIARGWSQMDEFGDAVVFRRP